MRSLPILCALSTVAAAAGQAATRFAGRLRTDQASLRRQYTESNGARAEAVREAFQFAWDGYYQYAFPNDELLPLNNSYGNSRNGWGASAVDALSTALVMRNKDVVNDILDYVPTIDWSVSYQDSRVSLFETTIRYMGGLLSAYDLLQGPLNYIVRNPENVPALLRQARYLANNLSFAFNTPTGIPHGGLFFGNRSSDGSDFTNLAEAGTLVLEWTRLSDLTGDPSYGRLAQRAEEYLLNPQPQGLAEPFPGLVGSTISIKNGSFVDNQGGWGGGADSFYEYLIKMFVYDPSRFGKYRNRWILAADSSIAYLAQHPSSRPDLTFLGYFDGSNVSSSSSHLACFDGGNFILGGLVLQEQKYIDFGLQLVDSCEETYKQTLTGIGPNGFSWDSSSVPRNQTDFYQRAGFFITDSYYVLRPEVIESFYYAYRATGNRTYQDYAWNAFYAINNNVRMGSGFSSVTDVNAPGGGASANFQESFLFAEVLKYSYLIQSNQDDEWHVNHNGVNEWVFNTEAHPMKVAGTSI